MAKTKISFSFSGVGRNAYHDGAMSVNYFYILPTIPTSGDYLGEKDYVYFLSSEDYTVSQLAVNFKSEEKFDITSLDGLLTNSNGGGNFSIYRREYQEFQRYQKSGKQYIPVCTKYIGPWEPVALRTDQPFIRDFNITSGRSYQYTLYPISGQMKEVEANEGIPVRVNWSEWSLAELIPVETPIDAPIIRKAYEVDINNIWLFKYSLQTGEQTQNFQKQDIQTLGQYNKFGFGQQNFISGNVSCLLGSEIVPYSKEGYIERRRQSITTPLSTNEKVEMLRQWRKLAFSPNPKLLKDIKGQSWIVQIVSSTNSPQNFYKNQPDTISFSWKEVDNTEGITIIGSGAALPQPGECNSVWSPKDDFSPITRCKN